jgi:release factor glutamine methyltransferase
MRPQSADRRAQKLTVGAALLAVAGRLAGDEARDLVAIVLDVPRFGPSMRQERELTLDQSCAIDAAIERRLVGMPLAYAARRAAFRHLTLYVDERVLIPRPETEQLVELVLERTNGGAGTAIDVGTGSGAIALSLAVEGGFERVIGTDVSADAVAVARLNATRIDGLRSARCALRFHVGSYLEPCADLRASVVVSNPPYIATSEASELPSDVRDWEPSLALFAEDGGLAAIGSIAREAGGVLEPGGLLALEVDSRRAGRAAEMVSALGWYGDVTTEPDLAGRARFVLARRTEA